MNHITKDDVKVEYLETPVISENDILEYRVIRLPNGLTALLISNTEERDDTSNKKDECSNDSSVEQVDTDNWQAECSLYVGVGSFSDPPEVPGMAHFLEHMVFMGSEKYPQYNDFHEFISIHGGHINALTEHEHTKFTFDIQEKHLLPALDRFAQFFIKPLMKRDAIKREREAIESEFQLALPHNSIRKRQLMASFARTGHPVNKFTCGNLITLRDNVDDDKLYEELHKFRKRHYSAHRIKLAIQAMLPLHTLEKYITQCFADVPNNGLPPDDFTAFKDGVSFDTPTFRKMYKVKPFNDTNQLQITWAMPSVLDFCKSKPRQYIASIIGHKGKGSLISYLRKKMWGLDLFSFNYESDFEDNSMYTLFKITVMLSDKGQQHLEEILNTLFSFINLLKKEGPQKRIYDELCTIKENDFRFLSLMANVDDLCKTMHFYVPRDYITGNSNLYFEYNPEAIQKCLNYIVPETANIMIFNKDFDLELKKVEPWYKTKYTDIEIPEKWIERWKSIEPLPDFHLPLQNIFIASDFSLISIPAEIPRYPVKLHEDDISEIWYRPLFHLPRCYMNFRFISSLEQSLKNVTLMKIYCNVLRMLLIEELYPALAAGFTYDIFDDEDGIIIKLDGFNEKLPLLLMTIVKYIVDYPNLVTKDLFEIVVVQKLKTLYNKFKEPDKLIEEVERIFSLSHYTNVDMYTTICNINFEEFQDFVKSFTDHLFIQCLVQGNMTQDAVIETVRQCIELINCDSLSSSTSPQTIVTQIPLGIYYCKLKNINNIDINSVVTNYYQTGDTSIELLVLIELLIIIMKGPLRNQLRIQEQLGYDVLCDFVDFDGNLGYSISVYTQADKYTTEYVDQRIEEFLKSFSKILEEFSEEKLNDVKEALVTLKQSANFKSLKEEVEINWSEIVSYEYMFDRFEREKFAIKDIKITELREWFAKHTLNRSNFRKLSVHVIGTDPKEIMVKEANNTAEDCKKMEHFSFEYIQPKKIEDHITNIEDYKNKLSFETAATTVLPASVENMVVPAPELSAEEDRMLVPIQHTESDVEMESLHSSVEHRRDQKKTRSNIDENFEDPEIPLKRQRCTSKTTHISESSDISIGTSQSALTINKI